MAGYTVLDCSILDSSLWDQNEDVRLVWITLLAMADRNGYVGGVLRGLAKRVNFLDCPIENAMLRTQKAINVLLAPDPHSRSKDENGARLILVDGGWLIVNHYLYRERARELLAKADNAIRVKRWRERQKERNGDDADPLPVMDEALTIMDSNKKGATPHHTNTISTTTTTTTPGESWSEKEEIQKALKRYGVKAWRQCSEVPGVTLLGVRLEADRLRQDEAVDSRGIGGIMANNIRSGLLAERVPAATLAALANGGEIESVCGHAINGSKCGHGSGGVFVIGESMGSGIVVPASDLRCQAIEYRPRQ